MNRGLKAIVRAEGHAAPLGLDVEGETTGYKQAAPTELWIAPGLRRASLGKELANLERGT